MRRLIATTGVALLLMGRSARAQAPEQELRPVLDEQMAAANAHDTDGFLASYLRSPDLIFVFNGEIIRGFDALREQQLKWWQNGASDVVYAERGDPIFTVLDSSSVIVTSALSSKRTAADGSVSTGEFVATTVWRKRPEGWRVIAAHESTQR